MDLHVPASGHQRIPTLVPREGVINDATQTTTLPHVGLQKSSEGVAAGQRQLDAMGPSPSNSSPSLASDDDSASACSDKCSREACSLVCCEEEKCEDGCIQSCFGFIDCDDSEACTRTDCAENECRDTAPPCFNVDCFQRLTDEDLAAAANLASHLLPGPGLATVRRDDIDTALIRNDPGLCLTQQPTMPQAHVIYPLPSTTNTSGKYLASETDYRCTSSASNGGLATHDRRFSYQAISGSSQGTGTQMDLDGSGNTLSCQWGNECDEQFYDWGALDEHIYRTHIKPQNEVQCMWDNCLQATDINQIMTHVKNDHQRAEDEQICRWSECTSTFPGPGGLENHVRSSHVPMNPLHCRWDSCGVVADDPAELSMHLQTDHFPSPPFPWSGGSGDQAKLASQVETEICQWLAPKSYDDGNRNRTCGLRFADASALQQHIKDAHTNRLTKTIGFICQWAGCPRNGTQPFGQKSKLERHIQIHTGCRCCSFGFQSGLSR